MFRLANTKNRNASIIQYTPVCSVFDKENPTDLMRKKVKKIKLSFARIVKKTLAASWTRVLANLGQSMLGQVMISCAVLEVS